MTGLTGRLRPLFAPGADKETAAGVSFRPAKCRSLGGLYAPPSPHQGRQEKHTDQDQAECLPHIGGILCQLRQKHQTGIPFRGVSEKPSGRNRELLTECKSKINYCLKYIKFLILITYFRLIRIDTGQRSNLFFGVNVRYSLDHGAIFSRREWRWRMNRNWPAHEPDSQVHHLPRAYDGPGRVTEHRIKSAKFNVSGFTQKHQ